MNISSEEIGQRQVVLTVEVEPEEVEKSLERAYRRLVGRTNVPGFRKGKAPRSMLERYLGRDALLDNALEDLVSDAYRSAVDEKGLDAVGLPRIDILSREPVSFKATVSLRPIVEIGDYHQLSLTPEPVEVPEKDIDSSIENIRFMNAPWEPVERPVDVGDLVTIDAEGIVDGKTVWSQTGGQYRVTLESAWPVAGFAEQLLGLQKEEQKEFTLTIPEDYPSKDVAGKDCVFKATVHEIKAKNLPELNDEFAKGVGDGFESFEALRKKVTDDLKARADDEAMAHLQTQAVDALVGMASVEYPPAFEDEEMDQAIREELEQVGEGKIRLDDYLTRVGKTEEQLREELKPRVVRKLTRSLVLGRLSEIEKIEVDKSEIDEEVERLAQQAGNSADRARTAFGSERGRHSIENMLMTRKTLKRLADIVTAAKDEASSPVETKEGEQTT